MYLILIDAHSKWIEAFCTPSATSGVELRTTFARFGLPETVLSDQTVVVDTPVSTSLLLWILCLFHLNKLNRHCVRGSSHPCFRFTTSQHAPIVKTYPKRNRTPVVRFEPKWPYCTGMWSSNCNNLQLRMLLKLTQPALVSLPFMP